MALEPWQQRVDVATVTAVEPWQRRIDAGLGPYSNYQVRTLVASGEPFQRLTTVTVGEPWMYTKLLP